MEQLFTISIKSVPISVKASVPFSNIIQIEFYDKSKALLPTGYHNVFTEINLVPFDRMKNILVDIHSACLDLFKVEAVVVDKGELTYTELELWRQDIVRKRMVGEDGLNLKTEVKKKPKIEQLKLF